MRYLNLFLVSKKPPRKVNNSSKLFAFKTFPLLMGLDLHSKSFQKTPIPICLVRTVLSRFESTEMNGDGVRGEPRSNPERKSKKNAFTSHRSAIFSRLSFELKQSFRYTKHWPFTAFNYLAYFLNYRVNTPQRQRWHTNGKVSQNRVFCWHFS